MTVDLTVLQWKILRKLLRAGAPIIGRELQLVPTKKTRNGLFLDFLVALGLLRVVVQGLRTLEDNDVSDPNHLEAVQLRSTYALTNVGEYAAEYGDFEIAVEAYYRARLGYGVS